MRIEKDPYGLALNRLFENQVYVSGQFLALRNQLENLVSLVRQKWEVTERPPENDVVLGTKLYVRDLTRPSEGGSPAYCLTGHRFEVDREGYLSMASRLASWIAGWVVAQSFEGFESFLKDTAARLVSGNPSLLSDPLRRRCEESAKDRVEWTCFNSVRKVLPKTKLLRLIRKRVPGLPKIESENPYGFNLAEWLEVIKDVRDAVTHCEGVISANQVHEMGASRWKLLQKLFSGQLRSGEYTLRLLPEEVERAMEVLRAYGYAIYKLVSESAAYAVDTGDGATDASKTG